MVKHADEVPVTYLNKGQAYSMSIIDTTPPISDELPVRYRTFIRISFEDEQQRQRPGACWQLWKEGRGTSEAHQRGGRLQAVEYVDTNQHGDSGSEPSRIEIEAASFDGFCVIWRPGPDGAADCSIAVRFNFLSTDFSHSKGVKGIPVRLCAKTEVIGSGSPRSPPPSSPEICYCKVKLFRDHGAERKLSNDVVHVRKTIDKLKQQVSQAETGIRDFGRKKRPGSTSSKAAARTKPGKALKHKRTWSMSSASSSGGGRPPAEEDLQLKLSAMQAMFTSTQPVSILYLRGSELDDPDLHPIHLSGESQDSINRERKDIAWNRRQSVTAASTTRTSSLVSPSPSSASLQSQGVTGIGFPSGGYNQSSQGRGDWGNFQSLSTVDLLQSPNPQHLASPPGQPVKILKTSNDNTCDLSGWIEALGVNSSYRPPSERSSKPGGFTVVRRRQNISNLATVACIYILPSKSEKSPQIQYYRAVYLMERTVQDLTANIAAKFGIEPTSVARTTYVNSKGLNIIVDDDFVREIREGQDMRVEVTEIRPEAARVKREWHIGPNEDEDDVRGMDNVNPTRFEIKVIF
jgi:CP2 transcription factor